MARLTPADQIEQSYDLAMMALADYLSRERDAATTINRLISILDRDSLRDAITEVMVDAGTPKAFSRHSGTRAMTVWIYDHRSPRKHKS